MHKMTADEQIDAILSDLMTDIRCAEAQATDGPFFPERNITAIELRDYASKCRVQVGMITARRGEGMRIVNALIDGEQ